MVKMNIISKGAEAEIIKFNDFIIKNRIAKGYRLKTIDEKLRKFRTNRETKVLDKIKSLNINAPCVIENQKANEFMLNNNINKKYAITMSHINGSMLKDIINHENHTKYAKEVGQLIAKIHSNNIIHGDLTTSNMMAHNSKVSLIDFGLSNFSAKAEDKAVDLHLLKEALNSKHPLIAEVFFKEIIENYSYNFASAEEILKRFEIVEKRGRNKH